MAIAYGVVDGCGTVAGRRRLVAQPEADPENELGGGQFRGSPAGSRGEGPVGGLGDRS